MFYFVFICFVNRAVLKDKIWWYHWISHWILCRKLYKNIFLAEKTNQVISIFLTDINTKTPKKRPHTQLFDVDVSREKGHNSVISSARNKFLYFLAQNFFAFLLRKSPNQKHVKTKCNLLWNFEKFLKTKVFISQLFYSQFRKARGDLELSCPELSKPLLTFSQGCILRG